MKKTFRFLLLTFSFCLMFASTGALAQSASTGAIVSGNPPLLGNDHSYSVTVKSSGVLVVNARIIISNTTAKEKTDFSFSGLKEIQGNIIGFQQIKGRSCKENDWTAKKCLEYEEPDYSRSYYAQYDEPNEYHPLDIKYQDGAISGKLPVAIESYKSGAIILSYYLSGQTKSGLFGQKRFEFSSLQDNDLIKNANIAVNTDADLYTKSERSRTKTSSSIGMSALSTSSSISSKAIDSAVSGIGSYGNWINKAGHDIVPGETFGVSGTYSKNWIGMYWKSVLIVVLVIVLLILAIWWLARKKPSSELSRAEKGSDLSPATADAKRVSDLSFREAATAKNFLVSFVIFICSVLIFAAGVYLFDYITKTMDYRYDIVVAGASLVLTLILCGAVIGYPIYLGVRKGINVAVVAIISYVAAIIVVVALGFILVNLESDSTGSNSTTKSSLSSPEEMML